MLTLTDVKALATAQGLLTPSPTRNLGRKELKALRKKGFRTYPQRPLSYSSLKEFAKGPLHYLEYLTKPPTTSAAMAEGKAFEACLLGRDLDAEFVIFKKPEPEKDFRYKVNQQAKKEAKALALSSSRELILADDLHRIELAAHIARQHPFIKSLRRYKLRQPKPKVIQEPTTKLRLIGIPDLDVKRGKIGIDIKFVHSVAEFERHIFGKTYAYWIQAAVYALVYGYEEFYFFATQNQPYVYAQAFHIDAPTLKHLKAYLVEHILLKFHYHLATGFQNDRKAVRLPEWIA